METEPFRKIETLGEGTCDNCYQTYIQIHTQTFTFHTVVDTLDGVLFDAEVSLGFFGFGLSFPVVTRASRFDFSFEFFPATAKRRRKRRS